MLPAATLAVYFPPVFRFIVNRWPVMHSVLVEGSYWWITAYVAVALVLMIQELFAITMRFCRQQFVWALSAAIWRSAGCICSTAGMGPPAQVYCLTAMTHLEVSGHRHLQYAPTIAGYVTIVVVNVICGVLGTISLLHYTQDSFLSDQEEMALERKFDIARTGASVFVHSIKNQLLANRILEKRISQELDKPEPDLSRVRACVKQLQESNEMLISRSEEPYCTAPTRTVDKLTTLGQIWDDAGAIMQIPDALGNVGKRERDGAGGRQSP